MAVYVVEFYVQNSWSIIPAKLMIIFVVYYINLESNSKKEKKTCLNLILAPNSLFIWLTKKYAKQLKICVHFLFLPLQLLFAQLSILSYSLMLISYISLSLTRTKRVPKKRRKRKNVRTPCIQMTDPKRMRQGLMDGVKEGRWRWRWG